MGSLILAATGWAETQTRLAIMEQRWAYTADAWPCGAEPLVLPVVPLLSVDSAFYTDANGDRVDLDLAGGDFVVDTLGFPGHIRPAYGTYWPAARYEPASVRVDFTAGFASSESPAGADGVPEEVRQAVLMLVEHLYSLRGAAIAGTIVTELPIGPAHLLDRWRQYDR